MSTLVIAEIKGDSLKKVSRELASAARSLGGPVAALVFNGNDDQCKELLAAGADVALKANLADYSPQGAANIAHAVAQARGAKIVLLPHSMQGKDFAGRLAVKLGAALVADVVGIKGNADELEVRKPVYSGKAYAGIKVKGPAVITVRPNAVEIVTHSGENKIEAVADGEGAVTARLTDIDASGGSKIQLQDASIIVSGGRGIKGPENWPILQELCDVLGAALGASRAAVDAGWIPHSHQVGQTGKTVSPNCYIACGISGAIQHMAGMGSSKYIVAINKDADAPIFKVATYGVVDDLFKVVPALTAEFKKVLG